MLDRACPELDAPGGRDFLQLGRAGWRPVRRGALVGHQDARLREIAGHRTGLSDDLKACRRGGEIESAMNRPRRHEHRLAGRQSAGTNDRPVTLLRDRQLSLENAEPLSKRVPMRRRTPARLSEHVDDIEQTRAHLTIQQERDVVTTGNDIDGSLAYPERRQWERD